MNIFVYGTLKRGHGNYRSYLEGRSMFLGTGSTYDLFHMRNVGFPVLLPVGDPLLPVFGEVFEIKPGPVLAGLDRLEGNGHMYQREERLIHMTDGDVPAWVYIGMPEHWHGYERLPLANQAHNHWEF